MEKSSPIVVQITVKAPLEVVWKCWTDPEHIKGWAFADPSWEAPEAENDVRVGGKFRTKMTAKDGSAGFDFTGTYTRVEEPQIIEYDVDDGRHVKVEFESTKEGVTIKETFDPENENSIQTQRDGWHAILENFKHHTEAYE